jgi:hypothetical protein
MISFVNFLKLPQDRFGIIGIYTANIVSLQLKNGSLTAEYNSDSGKISILNTFDFPKELFQKNLYNDSLATQYDLFNWYPVIDKERDTKGNLQISFCSTKSQENLNAEEASIL